MEIRVYIEDEVSTNKNERPELGFGETIEIVQSRRSTTTTLSSHSLFPMAFTLLLRYSHIRSRHLAQSGMHE